MDFDVSADLRVKNDRKQEDILILESFQRAKKNAVGYESDGDTNYTGCSWNSSPGIRWNGDQSKNQEFTDHIIVKLG